jgi:hypothetical protein
MDLTLCRAAAVTLSRRCGVLFHVGVDARLAALAYFVEASVRRVSYAGMLVGTTVVVTVGLALCGIRQTR